MRSVERPVFSHNALRPAGRQMRNVAVLRRQLPAPQSGLPCGPCGTRARWRTAASCVSSVRENVCPPVPSATKYRSSLCTGCSTACRLARPRRTDRPRRQARHSDRCCKGRPASSSALVRPMIQHAGAAADAAYTTVGSACSRMPCAQPVQVHGGDVRPLLRLRGLALDDARQDQRLARAKPAAGRARDRPGRPPVPCPSPPAHAPRSRRGRCRTR